jgi:hypothetical protein
MSDIRCRFCGAVFASEQALRSHYLEEHRIVRPPERGPDPGGDEQPVEGEGGSEPEPGSVRREGGSGRSEGGSSDNERQDASGASDADRGERRFI